MEYLLIIAALCSNNILDFNLSVNTKVACIQRMSACYEKELKKEVGQALLSPLSPEARAINSCIYQKEMLPQ